jgi:hypothetical protein
MSTIKPRDLVRTPSGATGTVLEILPHGVRLVQLLDGSYIELQVSLLYLVRVAVPKPWPEYAF